MWLFLESISYLKSDLCSSVVRLHAPCDLFFFTPRFFFLFSRRQSKVETADTSSLSNMESQSSVCPIPINYFPSPKSSAGIPDIPLKRAFTAGWQRLFNMAEWKRRKTVKISRNHRLLIGQACPERHTTIAGLVPRNRRGQRRNHGAFRYSD